MHYFTTFLEQMQSKTVVYWGTSQRIKDFIESNCLRNKRLPLPHYVCVLDGDTALDDALLPLLEELRISTIAAHDITTELSAENTILLVGGFPNVEQRVLEHRLYYYSLCYFKSFETFFYLSEHPEQYRQALAALADERSKLIYDRCLQNIMRGSFWDPEFHESNPYFGNDLVFEIESGRALLAGGFDGVHVDRLLRRRHGSSVEIDVFEPTALWSDFLRKRYAASPNVNVHQLILWDSEDSLPFQYDVIGDGLSSRVDPTATSSYCVQSRTIDSFRFEDLALIALDVEGAEQRVLRGAAATIERSLPTVAVCLYHSMEDYIGIPSLVQQLGRGRYRLHVKQHSCVCAIETVLYAVKV